MKCSFLSPLFLTFLLVLPLSARDSAPNTLPDWALGGFARAEGANPVISPLADTRFLDPITQREVDWESNDTFNPAAVLKNGKVVVLYRAEDKSGEGIGNRTSRIGYAESADGIRFTRKPQPVFYPAEDHQKENEWPGGCEDPRVAVTDDGTYVMFYTQWNRKVARLGVATSTTLEQWTKHGPIFANAHGGAFADTFHKSASIVTKIEGDKQVITRIHGKYWMYWGEDHVYAATSSDLIQWEPLLDEKGSLKRLISPRRGYFDSTLTECGPPAILTEHGILLLYNGKNHGNEGADRRFNTNAYCAGQVLFDANDPTKPIGRLDVPFFRPMEAFEKSGQYENGTVFVEGLVYFRKKWFLYYGCADSRVGVAIFDPARPTPGDPIPSL